MRRSFPLRCPETIPRSLPGFEAARRRAHLKILSHTASFPIDPPSPHRPHSPSEARPVDASPRVDRPRAPHPRWPGGRRVSAPGRPRGTHCAFPEILDEGIICHQGKVSCNLAAEAVRITPPPKPTACLKATTRSRILILGSPISATRKITLRNGLSRPRAVKGPPIW